VFIFEDVQAVKMNSTVGFAAQFGLLAAESETDVSCMCLFLLCATYSYDITLYYRFSVHLQNKIEH